MSSETLIEYPTDISVKAMGLNENDFEALIADLVRPHVEPDSLRFTVIPSKEGKYLAVRVHFLATSHEHLLSIYAALKADERVLYTL